MENPLDLKIRCSESRTSRKRTKECINVSLEMIKKVLKRLRNWNLEDDVSYLIFFPVFKMFSSIFHGKWNNDVGAGILEQLTLRDYRWVNLTRAEIVISKWIGLLLHWKERVLKKTRSFKNCEHWKIPGSPRPRVVTAKTLDRIDKK